MRFLIIGGTKFIGPYVVRELIRNGHDVTVFHRGESEADLPSEVRHVRSPLAAIPVVQFPSEVLHPTPDIVIHMIPMGADDTQAAVDAFHGLAKRLVCLSSGDVYRAYGVFMGLEPGPIEVGLLNESSPLRSTLFPYRAQAKSTSDLAHYYEKILMEERAASAAELPATILRLPKVYGPGNNSDLATVYQFRHQPQWRWTHGYVENIAHAIVLASLHERAVGRTYNVGEEYTPTVGERLQTLPPSDMPVSTMPANFGQDMAYDTTRIRLELGYREPVAREECISRTLAG